MPASRGALAGPQVWMAASSCRRDLRRPVGWGERAARLLAAVAGTAVLLLAGCATRPPEPERRSPQQLRADIRPLLPPGVLDAQGWARDIQVAFSALELAATPDKLCAVIAVIQQESGFVADPPVPGLPAVARREIDRRAQSLHVPALLVDAALGLESPNGATYGQRLKRVRTEHDLSSLFEDFIGMVPMGRTLFDGLNPVRTAGPMQVSIDFAQAHADDYPYDAARGIRNEVFTRRGGVYFGTMHLLGYPAHYDSVLYRFADYNAGWYASRNAAFQSALSTATGIDLTLDGDVVNEHSPQAGETERAARTLRGRLDMSEEAIRRDLLRGNRLEFETTMLYKRVFALADNMSGRKLARAVLPRITLHSPKITRKLTTAWFAQRVNSRWKACMAKDG